MAAPREQRSLPTSGGADGGLREQRSLPLAPPSSSVSPGGVAGGGPPDQQRSSLRRVDEPRAMVQPGLLLQAAGCRARSAPVRAVASGPMCSSPVHEGRQVQMTPTSNIAALLGLFFVKDLQVPPSFSLVSYKYVHVLILFIPRFCSYH
jgi:hypothetical protein